MAAPLPEYDSYNPYYEGPRRRFGTSPMELLHIAVAFAVLATVLWLAFKKNKDLGDIGALPPWAVVTAAVLISLLGFVLHELGHKFTAQHFGHWSEFRANFVWLGLSLVIAFTTGFPLAAPGATWHTAQGRTEQGKISAMGPLVNFAVATVALFVALAVGLGTTVAGQLALILVYLSAFLGVFNLVPLGPLDGRKVIGWNPFVWGGMVALGVGLFWYATATLGV